MSPGFSLHSISRLLVVILLMLVTVSGTYYSMREQPRLVIVCDGRTAAVVDLSRGPVVVWYNWTHSVEGSIIAEKILASPHGLVLVEAWAKSFGAGHPYSSEEIGGSSFAFRDGYMVYGANQSLGYELSILAYEDYHGNITLETNGLKTVVCPDFSRGTIMVLPHG